VREAEAVKLAVGILHLVGDPGALLPRAGHLRAVADHVAKGAVQADLIRALPERLAQGAGDPKLAGKQHEARVRRVPQDRLSVRVPGEDPAGVGPQQAAGSQVAAQGEEAAGISQLGVGEEQLLG